MTAPIHDRLAAETGIIIDHGRQDIDAIRRLWHTLTGHDYHDPDDTTPIAADRQNLSETETPMSVLDDLKNILDKGEEDAAKVVKYESEPLVAGIIDMLEAVPEARGIIQMILGAIGKLASMAPPAAPEAGPNVAPVDPQIQTGIAV